MTFSSGAAILDGAISLKLLYHASRRGSTHVCAAPPGIKPQAFVTKTLRQPRKIRSDTYGLFNCRWQGAIVCELVPKGFRSMRIRAGFRRSFLAAAFAFALGSLSTVAHADVVARISLSSQQMVVYVDGEARYDWAVSTARRGYRTPVGSFRPTRMNRMWYSRKYDNAPMPNSVFFLGGYAVHGTPHIRSLGQPASHGCVRLHPENARTLYNLIADSGMGHARIVITR
jgi:hypothetical protein